MMAISVCVNDAVLLLYMLLFKSCFGSSCDSHQLLLLVVISVLQRYRFQYFNRLLCDIICTLYQLMKLRLKPKMLLPYFLR